MNAHILPREAIKTESWFSELPAKLDVALAAYDFRRSNAYIALSKLAPHLEIVGISLDAESAVIEDQDWVAPGTLYVYFRDEGKKDEAFGFEEACPISVKFSVADSTVTISEIVADLTALRR